MVQIVRVPLWDRGQGVAVSQQCAFEISGGDDQRNEINPDEFTLA
jgi:hypothetical protein